MKTQIEYMKFIKEKFKEHIENNYDIFNSDHYNDKKAVICIENFKKSLKASGLNLRRNYVNGIGMVNMEVIVVEDRDSESLAVQKEIAWLNYRFGIHDGCHIVLTDLETKEKIEVGHAR